MLASVARMKNYININDLRNIYKHFVYIGPSNKLLGLSGSDLDLNGMEVDEFRQYLWHEIQRNNMKVLASLRQIKPKTTIICWDLDHGELIARAANWLADKEQKEVQRVLPKPNFVMAQKPVPARVAPAGRVKQVRHLKRKHRVVLAGVVFEQ